jgi:hypothetical protein
LILVKIHFSLSLFVERMRTRWVRRKPALYYYPLFRFDNRFVTAFCY